MDDSKCARCRSGPVLPNGLCLRCTEADGTELCRSQAELAALRAENERQQELLNTAVVKLDSCYQDYKKYRKASERKDARIAELKAALSPFVRGSRILASTSTDGVYESWDISVSGSDFRRAAAALEGDADDKLAPRQWGLRRAQRQLREELRGDADDEG